MDEIKIQKTDQNSSLEKGEIKEVSSKNNLVRNGVLIIGFSILIFYYLFSSPVRSKDALLHFSSNDSLSKISNKLGEEKIVKHPFLFKIFIKVSLLDRKIPEGDYLFKKDVNFFKVVLQVCKGDHGVEPIKITFIEGVTKNEMAKILADKISSFRKDLFLSDSRSKEGYLFPDTYFFFPLSTTDEILKEMTADFKKRVGPLETEIKNSGKSLNQIITMASILEKEAGGKEDIEVISGILWKRIRLGMPLQVDAVPSTYKESGLPDAPISNPGLVAIKAAIHPKDSPYLFYLHDDNGVVHYAVDFSQHRSNIARYLK